MSNVQLVLQVLALLCEVFATFGLFTAARVAWCPAGLALWFLSFMLGGFTLHTASAMH
jgi:hypothetical protein